MIVETTKVGIVNNALAYFQRANPLMDAFVV